MYYFIYKHTPTKLYMNDIKFNHIDLFGVLHKKYKYVNWGDYFVVICDNEYPRRVIIQSRQWRYLEKLIKQLCKQLKIKSVKNFETNANNLCNYWKLQTENYIIEVQK